MLENFVHTYFVLENFSVSWCLFYFLLLSAGSPQICLLDICLVQVLSFLFCLVSEPGRSEPGALFFCLVSGPFRSGLGALFVLLGILGQIRSVPANSEKRVAVFRRWFG